MHKTEAHAEEIIHEINYSFQRSPECSHLDDLSTLQVGTEGVMEYCIDGCSESGQVMMSSLCYSLFLLCRICF